MDLSSYHMKFYNEDAKEWKKHNKINFEQFDSDNIVIEGNLLPFNKCDITVMPHMPWWQVSEHSHDFFEFMYVYQGSCKTKIGQNELLLSEGDLCLMNLNTIHTISTNNHEKDKVFNILINPSILNDYFFNAYTSASPIISFFNDSFNKQWKTDKYMLFHREKHGELYETIVQVLIAENFENQATRDDILICMFTGLLIELTRVYQEEIISISNQDLNNRDITEIIQYMFDHCNEVSLTSLADIFGYSPKYLSFLIKKYSGHSFSEILLNMRLTKFTKIIADSNLSIQEVMNNVGYTNSTWFTKKFKQRFGVTPAQYRKK